MLFALDYDGTYTESAELWDIFITSAIAQGHTVICCTMRYEETESVEVKAALENKVDAIVFTGRQAKLAYLFNLGVTPDVWIDDAPHWIFQSSK